MGKVEEATVGHLLRGNGQETEVLLGLRDSLRFNGIWNGPGGHIEDGEDVVACLRRELKEEIGVIIDPTSVRHFATTDIYYPNGNGHGHAWRVHFFSVTRWIGEPRPVEGFIQLDWFPLYRLPYQQMMPDQIAWLPLAISNNNGHVLHAEIFCGDNGSNAVERGNFQFIKCSV